MSLQTDTALQNITKIISEAVNHLPAKERYDVLYKTTEYLDAQLTNTQAEILQQRKQ